MFSLLIFSALGTASVAQDNKPSNSDGVSSHNKWQAGWKYFKMKRKTTGVILEQHPTGTLCSYFATASNAVIVTSTNDTIRVLELCNANQAFFKGVKIEITPAKIPPFFVNFIPSTKFDEKIKRTTYGIITKIK